MSDDMLDGMTFHIVNNDGTATSWTEPTLVEERTWRDVGHAIDISSFAKVMMKIEVQGMGGVRDHFDATVESRVGPDGITDTKSLLIKGCGDYEWSFSIHGTVMTMNVSGHSVRCCSLCLAGQSVDLPPKVKSFRVVQHWIDADDKIPEDVPCAAPTGGSLSDMSIDHLLLAGDL